MVKDIVVGFLMIIFLSPYLLAREQYALKEGLNCSACHYNPSGGGALNIKGRYYERHDFSLDGYKEYLASLKQMLEEKKKDKKGEVTEFLSTALERISIQGKLRTLLKQTFERPKDVARDNFDLLDALATFGFQVHDKLTLVYSTELNTLHASDAYVIANGPFDISIQIGQFTPPFGLNSDDHTIMVRSMYGLAYYLKDTGFTLGYEHKGIFVNFSVLNAFRKLSAASGGTDSIGDPSRGLGITTNLGFRSSNFIIGISGLHEKTGIKGDRHSEAESLLAAFGALSWQHLHLSSEVDLGFNKGIGTGTQATPEPDESPRPVKRATAQYAEPFYGKITSRNRPFGEISLGTFSKLTYEILPQKWEISLQHDTLSGNYEFMGDGPIRVTGATKFYPWKNFSLEPQFKYNITPSNATSNAKNRNKHQFYLYASASF